MACRPERLSTRLGGGATRNRPRTPWSRCPNRRTIRAFSRACLLLLVAGCATPSGPGATPAASAPPGDGASDKPFKSEAYKVDIVAARGGDDLDRRLKRILERSSQLVALADRPPLTEAGLRRRIEGDIERFNIALRSEGYYAASITSEIERAADPLKIRIVIDLGPPFLLDGYAVSYVGANKGSAVPEPTLDELGVKLGDTARAPEVVAGERRALRFLTDRGRPLASVEHRDIVVDHADNTMNVRLDIDPGPPTRFGPTTITGLTSVAEDYVRVLIPWKQGEPFDQRLVDEYRRRLLRTGLFAAVSTTKPDTLSADDELPLTTSLIEGKHRSIGFGAKYATGEGPAGKVFWEHRNLLGRNEDLGVALEAGKITQSAEVTFRRPDFRLPEQDLFVESIATRTNSTAYNELSVETKAGIQRPLGGDWSGSVAGSLEWASLKDQKGTGTSLLVGLPLWLAYNHVNNRFNPTKGARLRLETTPYAGWFDQPISFLVNEISGSAYIPLDAERRFVLAARAKIGSIVGQSRAQIPANKRFYAGGGDSIRGYKFQDVGLLDDDNDPLGGRSLFETSVELRTRVWGNFGVAQFIDGGNVFDSSYPDFAQPPRWAAGLGLRYITPIGPVRLDVAFPLNRRDGIDDAYQFYIALGEAF